MSTLVTKEQYNCAMNLIKNYRTNPDFKSCGIEYMDDAERAMYELAVYQIYQYGQQIAAHRRALKQAKIMIKGA